MVSNLKCLRFNKTDLIIKYLISDIGKTVNKVDGVDTDIEILFSTARWQKNNPRNKRRKLS
jgi:hypothetical protein